MIRFLIWIWSSPSTNSSFLQMSLLCFRPFANSICFRMFELGRRHMCAVYFTCCYRTNVLIGHIGHLHQVVVSVDKNKVFRADNGRLFPLEAFIAHSPQKTHTSRPPSAWSRPRWRSSIGPVGQHEELKFFENFWKFLKILDNAENFWKRLKIFDNFWKVFSKILKNSQAFSKIFKNSQKCSKKLKNY